MLFALILVSHNSYFIIKGYIVDKCFLCLLFTSTPLEFAPHQIPSIKQSGDVIKDIV